MQPRAVAVFRVMTKHKHIYIGVHQENKEWWDSSINHQNKETKHMKRGHYWEPNSRSATHKSPVFHKTKCFITIFKKACHLFAFWARNHVHAYSHCSSNTIQNWNFLGFQAESEIWAEKGLLHFTTWWKNQIRFPKRCFLVYLFEDATRNLII